MSRIVKSMAVVDARPGRPSNAQTWMETELMERTVLKSGVMNAYGIHFKDNMQPLTRDAYLDEINRLRLEAEEAKTELEKVRREIDNTVAEAEARAEAEALRAEQDRSLLDDEIFLERQSELQNMAEAAKAQAREIIENAQAGAAQIQETARAEGYAEGIDKGSEEARRAFEEEARLKLQELSDIIMTLTGYGPELMREREKEFVALSAAIASKVIGRDIKSDPEYILDMLRDAVQKNLRENYITISLSPDMLPLEAKACGEVVSLIEGMAGNISVYVEKEAGERVCVMETPKGVIDMSVETQLDNIVTSLLEQE